MSHPLRDLLHRATHRVPGVPAHAERAAGHRGRVRHGHGRFGHRPPRVLVGWQTWIARLFGASM
ncbi:hypothetical protein [Herbidospora sp. RD11066]